MCRQCLVLIIKADDDDFLDSLELTNAERKLLEKLYKESEDAVADLLQKQGEELDAAIQALGEELASDTDELLKIILQVQAGEFFQEKFTDVLHNAFLPLFDLAGESEAVAVNESAKWKTANKAAAKFTNHLESLVPDINETSKDHLLRAFSAAIEQGKTPAERALMVKEISKEAANGETGPFSMDRAVRISRTMSTAAANGGKLEGWRQSGVVQGKRWRSANNKRTRTTHRKANGQVRMLDEPFKIGKSKLMYPGDSSGSPEEVINCRCTMQALFHDPSTEYKITENITKEDLIDAALSPKGKRDTEVGRAFQKHSVRPDTVYTGEITGNPKKNTDQGLSYIQDLLDHPEKTAVEKNHRVFGDIIEVKMPSGQGARWSSDGKKLIGFLEPNKKTGGNDSE